MGPGYERTVSRLRRRVGAIVVASELARQALVALFAIGSIALLLRYAFAVEMTRIAPLYSVLLVLPLTAWLRARRRGISRATAANWLDVRTGRSGLLVTLDEVDDPAWRPRGDALVDRTLALPRLAWRPMAARLLPAALFAALPFVLARVLPDHLAPSPSYEAALERLREKLNTLEEVVDLEAEERADLEDDLERLRDQIEGARPEVAFEALDRLEDRLDARAEEAREEATEASANLEEIAAQSTNPSAERGAEAAEDLTEALEQLDESGLIDPATDLADLFDRELASDDWKSALGELSGEQTAELSTELLELLRQKMDQLADAGMLGEGELPRTFDPNALAALLEGASPGELRPVCDDPDCEHRGGT